MTITHKTGYLYQAEAYESAAERVVYPGSESWHRTYRGARKAKERNEDRGAIYRLTGDDSSVLFSR